MKNNVVKNTTWLFVFQIAKILFPFITLPYLTRVLSTEVYGSVAYVKTVMNYMQIIVDFGFVLSATKNIVKLKNNKKELEYVVGDTLIARIIMGIIGFIVLMLLIICLPILRHNMLYTVLSYIVIFESVFLMDYLFRGLEKMHVITIRFILMKIISTLLTFILIKSDSNVLLIPILDILSSLFAIGLVFIETKKLNLEFKFSGFKKAFLSIKESFVYFLSNAASTSFNALSTILIGIMISSTEVAFWCVCMQVIGSITACYSPISDGIYPEMIRSKDYNLILKIEKIFIPIVFTGCILMYVMSTFILNVLGGEKYLEAVPVFRLLIPVLFFGFLSVIHGWPALGAIDKNKETTITTIISIIIHILLLIILIIINRFTLINIALIRSLTEIVLFLTRFYYCKKYNNLFIGEKNEKIRT